MTANTDYWIYDWAKFRQDELILIPCDYEIHSDFTLYSDKNEVKSVFEKIHKLFAQIFSDMAETPEEFSAVLYDKNEHSFFSQAWRDSGRNSYNPLMLLCNLFICGEITGQSVIVSIEKYKSLKYAPLSFIPTGIFKVKNMHILFKKLVDYGFVFQGLKNNKLTNQDITITFPDNTILLFLFKMIADKAYNTNRISDFLRCHFRLLQDDMNTANYGNGADNLADRVQTNDEKEFIYEMDKKLISIGMFRKSYGGYEGPGLAYYKNEKSMNSKGPYSYRMVSRSADIVGSITETEKMLCMLRIRNVSNCLEYLKECPDSVKRIFTEKNDTGCARRRDNSCKHGVSYKMNGQEYWRFACCAPAFYFKQPKAEDIPYYIKLVELGEKK